jgi:hypothetical protein
MVGNAATLSGSSALPAGLSSFTSLSCARMHIGMSAATAFYGVDELSLYYHTGSAAATNRITIDGTTFSVQTDASVTDMQINASDATGFACNFASAISLYATYLEVQGFTTTATAANFTVRLKDNGVNSQRKGFDFLVNANEAATLQLEVRQKRRQGVIEFTQSDLSGTNTTYTDFAVRLNSTSTLAEAKVVCIVRECEYSATNSTVIEVKVQS